MPRLIDKRDAIKHLKKLLKNNIMPTEWYEGAKSAITLLKKEPTVDAEPVVRCKDCKWWKSIYFWEGHEHKTCARETYELPRKAEDFCSYGEMREVD